MSYQSSLRAYMREAFRRDCPPDEDLLAALRAQMRGETDDCDGPPEPPDYELTEEDLVLERRCREARS